MSTDSRSSQKKKEKRREGKVGQIEVSLFFVIFFLFSFFSLSLDTTLRAEKTKKKATASYTRERFVRVYRDVSVCLSVCLSSHSWTTHASCPLSLNAIC